MRKLIIFSLFLFAFTAHAKNLSDPLPSWNDDSAIKKNIIQFVKDVTNKNNSHYVSPENRIATFDNDGTLWVEQPIYTQFIFASDRIKKLASQHPEWKNQLPYKAILENDYKTQMKFTVQDFAHILAVTHSGMSVGEFQKIAKNWIKTAENPHFKQHYNKLIYQPMLEVMNYLRENKFKVYIVTGGGQDFVRAFSEATYAVPSEQVIGTAGKTKYIYQNKKPVLIKTPEVLIVDDKTGKPEAIDLFIGKKPIIAFGNSDGDRQMLEWTQSNEGKHLMLLVHHDDAKREYAYDIQSKVGTFSSSLMNEAKQNHWDIISMQHDWKVIFPFDE